MRFGFRLHDFIPDDDLVERVLRSGVLRHDKDEQLFQVPMKCRGEVSIEVEREQSSVDAAMVAQRLKSVHLERLDGGSVLVEESGHGAQDCEHEEHGQGKEDDRVEANPHVVHGWENRRAQGGRERVLPLAELGRRAGSMR